MKICHFSDVHWGAFASLVRSFGTKYTIRLEHLIDSMNWVNQIALEEDCDCMVCDGDYFDRFTANDQELTALKDIVWNNLKCYFLVGNHESSVNDLQLNLTKVLESENHIIVSDPNFKLIDNDTEISFLPYIVESNRKPLNQYINKNNGYKKHIVFSHNDIAGIQYGSFTSVTGFSKEEIEANCDLYLNGHLHNSEWVSDKILNVGSLSAHNFTNDSSKYSYGIWILDTDNLSLKFIENPFGFNFYKIAITDVASLKQLDKIKNNAVLSISCAKEHLSELNSKLEKIKTKIVAYKTLIIYNSVESSDPTDIIELQGTDHIQRFIDFCHEKLENSKLLEEELFEICK